MLITFSSPACANITMFEKTALNLLRLMGHSTRVPGAILAKDIPAALARLETALANNKENPESKGSDADDYDEAPVTLANQAFPMISFLKTADKEATDIMWDISSKHTIGI
ncbi:DUF1840 domain-containing protein [uncultured Amphritea sp.]|uniref:DUF1840 domain-containing protein n=1 Tax=uncultured Amphritea sp. TaxID=981605 RepID=UPI00263276D4|nr:DUF1840 domain-containing protein [uncultured Amphritea sp.]